MKLVIKKKVQNIKYNILRFYLFIIFLLQLLVTFKNINKIDNKKKRNII